MPRHDDVAFMGAAGAAMFSLAIHRCAKEMGSGILA